MAYVPMSYTTGNWTVNEKWVPTSTATYTAATKTVTVTNFNWPTDFSFAKDTTDGSGKVFTCQVNTDMAQNAVATVAITRVADVYKRVTAKGAAFEKTPVSKLTKRSGYQVMYRLDTLASASNSVSAEEGDLYAGGWVVFVIQDHPAVTTTLVRTLAKHLLGMGAQVDSTVLTDLVEAAIRGDLNPTI